MSFKGKTDKGRYDRSQMTQDHHNCLVLKKKLRKLYMDQFEKPFSIIEPFAGREELFKGFYSQYEISERKALDIEPTQAHIEKADANLYPIGKALRFDVYDLDHHKLEVLQTFSNWLPAIKTDCVVFLTFGIMSFARKTFVKEKTVFFQGTDKLVQLDYSMSYNLPEKYITAACMHYGFKVTNLRKVRYKNVVSYYGFNLTKI